MKKEERLQLLIDGGIQSAADEKWLRAEAKKAGVRVCENNCKDALRDAAIILVCKLREKEYKKSDRQYILRAGVDVMWNGYRVNAMTDEGALKVYCEHGFPKRLMLRIAGEDV